MNRRPAAASQRFNIAVITIAAAGLRPHCSDVGGGLWTSESEEDRREAVQLCRGCPPLRIPRRHSRPRGQLHLPPSRRIPLAVWLH